ncbi:MAG TPA: DmsE family decaheme c-type cytochrome, partial [Candidatus Acidoferrales bacterium]|nr:DmsE family decaheme c-type cytochrome [Candidatus Acidoferrales bacterium]
MSKTANHGIPRFRWILVACLLASGLVASLLYGQEKAPAAAPDASSDYVGAEVCKTCHEDMPSKGFYKTYEDSPHYVTMLDTKKGPEWHGCEACHGPGKAHVEGGGDKTKIFTFKDASAKDISDRCLKCHQYGQEHANFSRSVHIQNNVSCVDCHSPHHPKENQFLMREKQPVLCYGCHIEIKQQFSRTFHHRVNEGLVRCTDCHNPHGGTLARQLRASSAEDTVCFKCHSDKAGPFVYEHQVVKIEGCVSCHIPHGSSNPRLLKRSQVNILCLECHSLTVDLGAPAVPSFHNQSQKYQACTLCHTAIHGS